MEGYNHYIVLNYNLSYILNHPVHIQFVMDGKNTLCRFERFKITKSYNNKYTSIL